MTSQLVSAEAERALLGCVLVDEWDVWGAVEEVPLTAEDFAHPENQALWRAFCYLKDQGTEITNISTLYALDCIGLLETCDKWLPAPTSIELYLHELWSECFSAKGCIAFVRMVKHYSTMRAPVTPRRAREMAL